ncbi:MAG: pyruvate ferredoxin oxidoreductase subunit gamma [Candidatus Methanoliparum thermophilum]|uniref:pyruvate synthase n=1 Tax=Methanoliparum thermophilum TaxID=2491083 RepID=A0A520KS40_METT2|nr:pyruvate ferredoxin oxidoreductase subunit gamma [Candidatus Methanoliparum sp. LAM-1]RZN64604.1 MAG: pyruvate ferredoxin oxidoreductase subunit gamma [Candidatus Methanoliparum thermophilum]BDC35773.1 Pyruvate synthase subunit C [Candidatus Methanoliparum sp. LAM-1]
MKEIRFHGRGGQGAVTAAELLAVAAFYDGYFSQAFPAFGVERRGAPVLAFTRISDKKIRLRSHIYNPDYVIVQDSSLISSVNIAEGLKYGGVIVINSTKDLRELGNVRTIDATKISLDTIGRPITNTTMLGAFAGAVDLISINSIKRAVGERFVGELREKNIQAVEIAYNQMKELNR